MNTSSGAEARFQAASDQSLLVYFDSQKRVSSKARTKPGFAGPLPMKSAAKASRSQNQITIEAHEQVRRLLRLLELEPIAGVRNLHPAYCSLLIKFDAVKMNHAELEAILLRYIERMQRVELPEPRLVEIPVCYGGEYGPDLKDVAELHGLTPEQAIKLHSAVTYIVYFLGFAPGFAYLGDVAEKLATPRLPTPRRSVPAGSVGIAGSQTGVYPIATPGGWRLLGRTPVAMFQPERQAMSLLAIGDRVRFVPISREKFAALERA